MLTGTVLSEHDARRTRRAGCRCRSSSSALRSRDPELLARRARRARRRRSSRPRANTRPSATATPNGPMLKPYASVFQRASAVGAVDRVDAPGRRPGRRRCRRRSTARSRARPASSAPTRLRADRRCSLSIVDAVACASCRSRGRGAPSPRGARRTRSARHRVPRSCSSSCRSPLASRRSLARHRRHRCTPRRAARRRPQTRRGRRRNDACAAQLLLPVRHWGGRTLLSAIGLADEHRAAPSLASRSSGRGSAHVPDTTDRTLWWRGVATLRRFIVAHPGPFATSVAGSCVFAAHCGVGDGRARACHRSRHHSRVRRRRREHHHLGRRDPRSSSLRSSAVPV